MKRWCTGMAPLDSLVKLKDQAGPRCVLSNLIMGDVYCITSLVSSSSSLWSSSLSLSSSIGWWYDGLGSQWSGYCLGGEYKVDHDQHFEIEWSVESSPLSYEMIIIISNEALKESILDTFYSQRHSLNMIITSWLLKNCKFKCTYIIVQSHHLDRGLNEIDCGKFCRSAQVVTSGTGGTSLILSSLSSWTLLSS